MPIPRLPDPVGAFHVGDITDHRTFAEYVYALSVQLERYPEKWARTDLQDFLHTLALWTKHHADQNSQNLYGRGIEPPTWSGFAAMLDAAARMDD